MVTRVTDPRMAISVIESVLLHEETRKAWSYYAPAKVPAFATKWAGFIEHGLGVCFALFSDGKPIGFILGMVNDEMLTGVKEALSYLWIVVPGLRRNGRAVELLDAFEGHAKAQGCKHILFGSSSFVKPEAMARLYRGRGYKLHAQAFRKEI